MTRRPTDLLPYQPPSLTPVSRRPTELLPIPHAAARDRPTDKLPAPIREDPQADIELAQQLWQRHPFREPEQVADYCARLPAASPDLIEPVSKAVRTVLAEEGLYRPQFRPRADDPEELLHNLAPRRVKKAAETLIEIASLVADIKPQAGTLLSTVPLIATADDPKGLVNELVFKLQQTRVPGTNVPVFPALAAHFGSRLPRDGSGNFINADEQKGSVPAEKLAKLYLKGTPFFDLLMTRVPLSLPKIARNRHMFVLGMTGWGKTQMLQHLIANDLASRDPPAIVVIEPKGDMTRALGRLEMFQRDPERLFIVDPDLTPALNMFDVEPGAVDEMIQQYGYIFGAIDKESPNQTNAIAFVAKLVITMKGNLRTFLRVLNEPVKDIKDSEYRDQMRALKLPDERPDQDAIDFFERQFFKGYFPQSKLSLASSVQNLISGSAHVRDMFCVSKNVLDMNERINAPGSLTIINTAQGTVPSNVSSILGRWFISQTLAAIYRRGKDVPEHLRKPVYLIVDEAHDYLDGNIEDILIKTRSYGLGLTLTTNLLSKVRKAGIEDAVIGSTAIKIVAPDEIDIDKIAPVVGRAKSDILAGLTRANDRYAEFVYYARTFTPAPIKVAIPPFSANAAPRIGEREFEAFRERFRSKPAAEADTPQRQPPQDQPRQRDPYENAKEQDGVIDAVFAEIDADKKPQPEKPAPKSKSGKPKKGYY